MATGDKIKLPSSGYSGTPLAKKLGIKPCFQMMLVNAPDYYFDLFTDLPAQRKILFTFLLNRGMNILIAYPY
jgi:hypothetical protein